MKTMFLFLLIAMHVPSITLAQHRVMEVELEPTQVFSSAGLVAACEAISNDNYTELSKLVQAGVDLDKRGKHGCTLLLWSWYQGNHRAFEVLLEMGADPHATLDSDVTVVVGGNRLTLLAGSSVAAIVVRFGRVQPQFFEKVVRYLRDANQRDAEGKTLLHNLMASADDQPIVRQLRDVQQRDPEWLKYLRESLASGDNGKLLQTAPFALLYKAGVQVDAVDSAGVTALEQYMTWLELSSVAPNRVDLALSTAIHLFQRTDYFDDIDRRARFIVELEQTVNRLEGSSPVLMTEGSLHAFKSWDQSRYDLLRIERDQVLFGDYGYYHFEEMYLETLDEEVNLAIQHISHTSRGGEVRPFEELCEVGFDLNARGTAGITHLFTAYTAKNVEAFEELLKLKADPDLRLDKDVWPFVSENIQSSDGAAFCPERGETVLLSAALNPERVPYLPLALDYSEAIDIRDSLNRNMLHRMLYHPLPRDQHLLLKQVVEAGADLNAQSIGGATPCHEAVFRNAALIPELVRLGADPTICDLRGRTVSDLLRQSVEEEWTFHEESTRALESLERLGK